MAENSRAEAETEKNPWRWLEFKGNGGAFFVLGIVFVTLGLNSQLTFLFVGLAFIALAFTSKDETPEAKSDGADSGSAADSTGDPDGR